MLNVLTAQLLEQQGLVAVPESIIPARGDEPRRMPDVLVDFQGLRLAVEGEFAAPDAASKARTSALNRVKAGIAHIGVALIYPRELKTAPIELSGLRQQLAESPLRYAIVTEAEADQLLLSFGVPSPEAVPFETGTVGSLAAAMRRSYEYLVKDAVLERAVKMLEDGISLFVHSLSRQPATTDRFMKALGISALPPLKRGGREPASEEHDAAADEEISEET